MKGINLFNSIQKLRGGFLEAAKEKNIPVNTYRTRNVVIHLKNGESAKFVHKGEFIDLHDHVNFFQMRGKESHTPAIMALYCDFNNIQFNDSINTNHTLHVQKISQMMILHMNNLPIPETMILNSFSYERNRDYIIENVSFPVVLKFNGDRGTQVWKVETAEELDKRLLLSKEQKDRAIKNSDIPTALVQEYIPNTHDFRVTMYNHEVFGVIKRISKDGFYNNWSRGADFEVSEITKEETKLCQNAADACGIDMAGVDIVRTENGPLLFEVNKSPQMNIKYSRTLLERIAAKFFNK